MGSGELNAGGNPASCFMLQKHRVKLQSDKLFDSFEGFTFYQLKGCMENHLMVTFDLMSNVSCCNVLGESYNLSDVTWSLFTVPQPSIIGNQLQCFVIILLNI